MGNAEGKDLPHHPADVVVCDASVGNVTIKFFEGLSTFIFDMLRAEFKRPPWGPIGYSSCAPASRASASASTTSGWAARRCSASRARS